MALTVLLLALFVVLMLILQLLLFLKKLEVNTILTTKLLKLTACVFKVLVLVLTLVKSRFLNLVDLVLTPVTLVSRLKLPVNLK